MRKNFEYLIFFASLFLVISITWAAHAQPAKKLKVISTLFPTYDFAKQIAGDKIEVSLLLPPGVEAHTFEPKPSDVVKINKADVFIYTGENMEPWVKDLLGGLFNKALLVVDASQGIELMAEGGRGAEGGHKDPHIWVDLGNAQVMVQTIADAFAQKDPGNRDFFLKNTQEYKIKLADLDRRFRETLSGCKHKTLIYGGHFVFGYLARRYGLAYVSPYEGFSPNAEPAPKAIVKLINKLKISGIKYIYCEEFLDPKVARTIACETGAKLELLHGAHNLSKDELNRGITFLDLLEDNLKKLKIGLECK